jgi:hypothetical protein
VNRRLFFSTLFGAAAVAANPEKLLWKPGKLISIPKPAPVLLKFGDVFNIAGTYARNPITGKATSMLQRFIATAHIFVGEDAWGLKVYPPIEIAGSDQRQIIPVRVGEVVANWKLRGCGISFGG